MERVWRFRIPRSLCILAWDLSFSSSHGSLIFMTLFFSASFSASYLYRPRALCSHPLQSAQPYTSIFTAVPAVCSYFFQNTPESIPMFFKNRDQGIIIGAVAAYLSMYDKIILYRDLDIICRF